LRKEKAHHCRITIRSREGQRTTRRTAIPSGRQKIRKRRRFQRPILNKLCLCRKKEGDNPSSSCPKNIVSDNLLCPLVEPKTVTSRKKYRRTVKADSETSRNSSGSQVSSRFLLLRPPPPPLPNRTES
jgi:hypothetical protein